MAIIIGLEGVLARHEWRTPIIESEGWEAYHSAAARDAPNQPMVQLVAALRAKGQAIYCLSGRPSNYYMTTKTWMVRHGVMVDTLLMRGEKDFRSDAELRSALLALVLEREGNVMLAIEEAEKACDIFRAAGIPTLQLTNPNNVERAQ